MPEHVIQWHKFRATEDSTLAGYREMVSTMSRKQRTLLFFALQSEMQRDYLEDTEADRRYVEAAFITLAQFGTLLIRAKGHTTVAIELDDALAKAVAGTAGRQ